MDVFPTRHLNMLLYSTTNYPAQTGSHFEITLILAGDYLPTDLPCQLSRRLPLLSDFVSISK